MSNELIVLTPQEQMMQANNAASVSKDLVTMTSVLIQGKKHVAIEGWQAVAVANGCTLGSRDVRKVDGGYTAIGELRRISDGAVLATAEGFVGDDEPKWSNKPEHAKRAMAQTRAMSRVGRSAFAHIVVMMGAELCTTPAEEMDGVTVSQSTGQQAAPPTAKSPKLDFNVLQSEVEGILDTAKLDELSKRYYATFPNMSDKQKAVVDKIIDKQLSVLGAAAVMAKDMFPEGE
jgi:hypothetical protein